MITLLIAILIIIDQKKFEQEALEKGFRPACSLQYRLFALVATGLPILEIFVIRIIIKLTMGV